ncbi:polysaccharide biosynthesis tyrosine autokinase [Geodermatophilus sp. SYSU D01119]
MTLRDVVAALRTSWWMLVAGVVIGSGLAFLWSSLQTPLYSSSTQLFVSTTDSTSTENAFQGSQLSQQRVASYAELLTGREMAERVIDRLDLDAGPDDLTASISASPIPGTVLIDVTVTDPSAEGAREIAEALGAEFPSFVDQLEAPDASGRAVVRVTTTEAPETASAPSSPQVARNIVLGALVGFMAAAAAAVARRQLDRSVRDPELVTSLTGVPVLGTVLRDEGLEKHHVMDRTGTSRSAEDYRQIRTSLQFLDVDQPPRVIMISSAVPSEGKTTAAVNLGLALADAGRRVTVVEADFRKPRVTRYLGLVSGTGLTNILSGTADVEDVVQKYGSDDFSVIAAGPTPPNPGELLASNQMAALLDKLRESNDFVLIDAPPLLPVADSTGLAVHTDGALLSVRYGVTRKDQLVQAVMTVERVGSRVLGVILNIVPPRGDIAAAHGYGYEYGYDVDRRPGTPG